MLTYILDGLKNTPSRYRSRHQSQDGWPTSGSRLQNFSLSPQNRSYASLPTNSWMIRLWHSYFQVLEHSFPSHRLTPIKEATYKSRAAVSSRSTPVILGNQSPFNIDLHTSSATYDGVLIRFMCGNTGQVWQFVMAELLESSNNCRHRDKRSFHLALSPKAPEE